LVEPEAARRPPQQAASSARTIMMRLIQWQYEAAGVVWLWGEHPIANSVAVV
jgi:hypothetical protein